MQPIISSRFLFYRTEPKQTGIELNLMGTRCFQFLAFTLQHCKAKQQRTLMAYKSNPRK